MLTYTSGRNLYGKFTKNNTSDNLTMGDIYINESIRTITMITSWRWLEAVHSMPTVANQEAYVIPPYIDDQLADVYVYIGTNYYLPEAVYDWSKWKLVLAYKLGISDIPRFYYPENGVVKLQPIPATDGNTLYIRGRYTAKQLSVADYTAGTIAINSNTPLVVTGNTTTFTAAMVGRYIQLPDKLWYKISSYTSGTVIGLESPYTGVTFTGASYIIGECPVIPEPYQIAPIYRAAALYWGQENQDRAVYFWKLYDGGYEIGLAKSPGGILKQLIDDEPKVQGPYIPPFGSTLNYIDPNYPTPIASGF